MAVRKLKPIEDRDPYAAKVLHAFDLLGSRFADLVTESVSYKPTEQLIEMSADGDDPMAPAYRALLTVRSGTTVRIMAEK